MRYNAHLQQYFVTDTYEFLTAIIIQHLSNQAANSIRFEIRIHLTTNTCDMDLFIQSIGLHIKAKTHLRTHSHSLTQ